MSYFKDRVSRRIGLRVEWVTALVVAGVVGWVALANLPPFNWLLAASEDLKQRWERPAERPPIPHAELLALSELATRANVPFETATERLDGAGITGHARDLIVEELAKANRVSAQRIYEVILDEGGARGRGQGRGASAGGGGGGGGAGSGRGGGGGSGAGWKTLEQFCADEGLAPAEVRARLEAKGIQFGNNQTLREIAVANGYDRPFELIYDHEIQLDLRFRMKSLMGAGLGRLPMNRFKARGTRSGFCCACSSSSRTAAGSI